MMNAVLGDYLPCTYISSLQRDAQLNSLYIFSLVHLRFFCVLQCIRKLTYECVYRAV